jgi:peptide subunit release factor RF-3
VLTERRRQQFEEQIELLDGLEWFRPGAVLGEKQTPVFGSALTNFGVRLFLERL